MHIPNPDATGRIPCSTPPAGGFVRTRQMGEIDEVLDPVVIDPDIGDPPGRGYYSFKWAGLL